MARGSITLPSDLLIFSPSTTHQPLEVTRFGGAIPADIRNAGQYTAWKRMMSLPTKCASAGQKSQRASFSSGKPQAVM